MITGDEWRRWRNGFMGLLAEVVSDQQGEKMHSMTSNKETKKLVAKFAHIDLKQSISPAIDTRC
jgi:hypothetical protein